MSDLKRTKPRGYYLYDSRTLDPTKPLTGIGNKIQHHIQVLNAAGHCTGLPVPVQSPTGIQKTIGMGSRLLWPKASDVTDADYLYIRRSGRVTRSLLGFLADIKRAKPSTRIVYEIPTYPYDGELAGAEGRSYNLTRDRINRAQLHRYVDRIADLSGHDEIFGIPTLPVHNGVDLGQIPVRGHRFATPSEPLTVMCAAAFCPWHGIDRMVAGMGAYYRNGGTRDVQLRLVGGGPSTEALKQQTIQEGIESHVTFLAPVAPTELPRLYDENDIAIESLGVHRRGEGTTRSYSIKSREYLAAGLPFLYSSPVDVLVTGDRRFFQAPEDDSPIDIAELLDWYDTLASHESADQLGRGIRQDYARAIDINHALDAVIDYLRTA